MQETFEKIYIYPEKSANLFRTEKKVPRLFCEQFFILLIIFRYYRYAESILLASSISFIFLTHVNFF